MSHLYEYNVRLVDGRVKTVLSECCPERHTSAHLRAALSDDLVRQGEGALLQEFFFNTVVDGRSQ